jgi:hypothetical protein
MGSYSALIDGCRTEFSGSVMEPMIVANRGELRLGEKARVHHRVKHRVLLSSARRMNRLAPFKNRRCGRFADRELAELSY